MKETGYKDIQNFIIKVGKSEFAAQPKKLVFISRRGLRNRQKNMQKLNI